MQERRDQAPRRPSLLTAVASAVLVRTVALKFGCGSADAPGQTLGRLLGIATPYNELLWRIADEMARSHETPGKYSADELQRIVQEG